MPDAFDRTEQLGMLLGAGYSLGGALNRIAARGNGCCAEDLAQVCGRIRQGLSEVEALREWAVLADVEEFRSAQELHALLREAGEKVGLATVYRTLQQMAADGSIDMLRTAEGESVYRACKDDAHHHHLVCRTCGATVEVTGPAVEAWADAVAAEHGFTDVSHTLEVFGTCPRCR